MAAQSLKASRPEVYAEVAKRLAAGESKTSIAESLGISRDVVIKVAKETGAYAPPGGFPNLSTSPPSPASPDQLPAEEKSSIVEQSNGSAVMYFRTDEIVRTLEDAIRVGQIDTRTWFVDRYEVSNWTVPMKVSQGKGGGPDKPIQTQQYRVKLYLRRVVSRALSQALDAIYDRIAKAAPQFPRMPKVKTKGEPFLAVFGLFDVHFGKLCWEQETGENYDLKIAETVFENAVADLVAESKHREIGQIVLPIGNDFFHMDNSRNTTYNGTPQDVDGRYWKVIEAGEMAVLRAVEVLSGIAPVRVVWVPGNHDPTTSGHLARTVWAYFRNSQRVEVDRSPTTRKYVHWGNNLLGFTHGNEERKEDLPNLMAMERPGELAASACREWLLGHEHRSRAWTTKPVESRTGTVVRVLQSLAGTDAYHARKGYVSMRHAAEVYWYGRDRGYAGHAIVTARTA